MPTVIAKASESEPVSIMYNLLVNKRWCNALHNLLYADLVRKNRKYFTLSLLSFY